MKVKKLKPNAGFTLIELLVTITIFVILTGVVLFSQNSFDNSILIKNLAYDISLTVRQAQNYGVDVTESQSKTNPFVPYGVYFNLSSNAGSNKAFVFFADTYSPNGSPNNMYDSRQVISCTNSECIQKYAISNGNYISKICAILPGQSSCNLITNSLTILFRRPNPEALIYPDVETNGTGVNNQASYADITVSSPNGTKKDIIVTEVGQIYVQ